MARSLKKGPFVDQHLQKKVDVMNQQNDRKIIKTWSRRSTVTPDFVGHTMAVHNGRKFIPVLSVKTWWGISLGSSRPPGRFGRMAEKPRRP